MNTVTDNHETAHRKSVWMRGLFMLIFMILLKLAATVLTVITIVQFFWLLITGEKNDGLTGFGRALGKWFRNVIRFQTMETDVKPFPWAAWPSE